MPAASGAPHDLADTVFRVGRAYGMTSDRIYQAVDDLPWQQPALTLVGGRPVYDPDGVFGSAGSA